MIKSITWAYAVTTVPSRFSSLLPRTLKSLEKAGFKKPLLAIDGLPLTSKQNQWVLDLPYEILVRTKPVRTYGNWLLTLWELFIKNPDADRYIIFQDDILTYTNLREYLEKLPYPDKGYCNLYTMEPNLEKTSGWYPASMRGKGGVALMFDNKAVETLLGANHLVKHRRDVNVGWKCVDGCVYTAMHNLNYKEHVHNPSLTYHTGNGETVSGNKLIVQANTFRGETYDALALLDPKKADLNWAKGRLVKPRGRDDAQ